MSFLQFAVAIIFPGAESPDIVSAAIQNHVHIVDKEPYDSSKDYVAIARQYEPYINGSRIMLLFVFPRGNSVLCQSEESLTEAINLSKGYSN